MLFSDKLMMMSFVVTRKIANAKMLMIARKVVITKTVAFARNICFTSVIVGG